MRIHCPQSRLETGTCHQTPTTHLVHVGLVGQPRHATHQAYVLVHRQLCAAPAGRRQARNAHVDRVLLHRRSLPGTNAAPAITAQQQQQQRRSQPRPRLAEGRGVTSRRLALKALSNAKLSQMCIEYGLAATGRKVRAVRPRPLKIAPSWLHCWIDPRSRRSSSGSSSASSDSTFTTLHEPAPQPPPPARMIFCRNLSKRRLRLSDARQPATSLAPRRRRRAGAPRAGAAYRMHACSKILLRNT